MRVKVECASFKNFSDVVSWVNDVKAKYEPYLTELTIYEFNREHSDIKIFCCYLYIQKDDFNKRKEEKKWQED